MTTRYYTLHDGVLELHEKNIIIFDDAKKQRLERMLAAISGLVVGVVFGLRGHKEKEDFWLYLGVFLVFGWLVSLLYQRDKYRQVENDIDRAQISNISFRVRKNGSVVAMIKNRKGQNRQVNFGNDIQSAIQFGHDLKALQLPVNSASL